MRKLTNRQKLNGLLKVARKSAEAMGDATEMNEKIDKITKLLELSDDEIDEWLKHNSI